MDDSDLTRMAIEEIVRDMHKAKAYEMPTAERKVNPLGKPNKRFLGRTINSVLAHNKRENDRKSANCRRRLNELDDRARRRSRNEFYSGERKKKYKQKDECTESEISHGKSRSSSSSDDESSRKRKKKQKRKKHKRSHIKSRSCSHCSDHSFSKGNDTSTHQFKNAENLSADCPADFYELANINQYTNIAAVAAAAYSQMSHMYSAMLRADTDFSALGAIKSELNTQKSDSSISSISISSPESKVTKYTIQRQKSNSSISSLLSLSSAASESITSQLASLSSLDEDENGVLTINVSSDVSESEEDKVKNAKSKKDKSVTDSDVEIVLSSDTDSESVHTKEEETLLITVDSDSNDCEANPIRSVGKTDPAGSDVELVESPRVGINQKNDDLEQNKTG